LANISDSIQIAQTALSSLFNEESGEGCSPVIREVTVTAYTNSRAETDDTPNITATGSRVEEGIVAVSRDLLKTIAPYGTLVSFEEHWDTGKSQKGRKFIVDDTMHPRKRMQVDIFVFDREEALKIGRGKAKVKIYNCAKNTNQS